MEGRTAKLRDRLVWGDGQLESTLLDSGVDDLTDWGEDASGQRSTFSRENITIRIDARHERRHRSHLT